MLDPKTIDAIIFGKNEIKNIVSLEVEDDTARIWTEVDGVVSEQTVPNAFWILTNKPMRGRGAVMKGNLHYKYGHQFKTRAEFTKQSHFWKNEDKYSIWSEKESLMVKDGYTYYKGMKSHREVSTLSFDIETTGLNHDDTAKVILIANTFRRNGVVTRKMFCYDEYETEGDMIDAWCAYVREINPAIITGHNIEIYDLPYLQFCAKRAGTYLILGRDGSEIKFGQRPSKFRKDGSQTIDYHKPSIYGREVCDTLFLSVKYDIARNFPNYRLKDIIKYLGLVVDGRVYYDAEKIRDNYTNPEEMVKIKAYAEHDGDEALMLLDVMVPSVFFWTMSVPKPFQSIVESASGSQLNALLVRSYLQQGHSVPKADDTMPFEGAISWGNPGIYSNAKKWDVASLYPSIIIQHGVFCKAKDPDANFLKMVTYFTKERLSNKAKWLETGDKYYDSLQESQKIGINSSYGLCGAPGLNFNYVDGAEFITRTGREILKKSILWATGKDFDTYWKPLNDEPEEGEEADA